MLNNLLLGFALVTSVMGASDANSREEGSGEQQHLRLWEGCKVQCHWKTNSNEKKGPSRGTITEVNHEGKVSVRFDDNTVQFDLPRDWVVEVLEYQDFRSALIEDLTVMILQYAMYDAEAIATLATDPALGLAHLYRAGRFVRVPAGIEVTGAGEDGRRINGFYRRREISELPDLNRYSEPLPVWPWVQTTRGRPWYKKYNGSYIYYDGAVNPSRWICCATYSDDMMGVHEQYRYYQVESSAYLPPAHGWTPLEYLDYDGEFRTAAEPAPTVSLRATVPPPASSSSSSSSSSDSNSSESENMWVTSSDSDRR